MVDYSVVKSRKRKVAKNFEDVSFNAVKRHDKGDATLKLPDKKEISTFVRAKIEPKTEFSCNDVVKKSKVMTVATAVMSALKTDTATMKPRLVVASVKKEKRRQKKSTIKGKLGRKHEQTDTKMAGRPTVAECHYVTSSLAVLHPLVVDRNDDRRRKTMLESCGMRNSVTEAVISTMLSQNTTDANSKAAFASMKKTFDTWEEISHPDNLQKLEDAIRVGGLAKTRSERIQKILQIVQKEHKGSTSMEYLRDLTDDQIKTELTRFPGLGPKTISCVLLFSLGRPEFPVDTHVLRICHSMGWVHPSHNRISAYEHLNARVPNELKMDLHCLLVAHGKHCHNCAANNRPQFPPRDGTKLKCPLKEVSKWKGIVPTSLVCVKSEPDIVLSDALTKINTHEQKSFTIPRLPRKIKSEPIPDIPLSSAKQNK